MDAKYKHSAWSDADIAKLREYSDELAAYNDENGNNTYFVFTHGWSQMLDAPDAEGYRYSLKPGFQAADKFGGSRAFANGAARTGGGIRYSSYYNMQSAFKFGIH